uniref:Putative ribonuclease H-like domain-containing protein n=1 Tax=Tanacetum cinerariifolium TaxID=118510 RepID=A0A6L2NTR1_TANCI|nr:putative ribonuclease H-like domain-containing protein [Tanacetum cinerariifolium]
MVKSSSSLDNEPCCSKSCKKNTESLNSKITDLTDKLYDSKNMLFHYKAGLSQVKGRLAEFKNQEVKYCEKIIILEFMVESRANCIKSLTKELELLKKEKVVLDTKLTGFQSASKDLDNLLESQSSSAYENGELTGSILSKPEIKFMRPADSPTVVKTDKKESVRKPTVKYAELYRKTTKRPPMRLVKPNVNNTRPKTTQDLMIILIQRVKRLERELKSRTPPIKIHKVDRGRSRHHFIRDCYEKKLISMDHIHTDDNVADLLTKPFDAGRFQYLVDKQAMRGSVYGNHIIYTTFIVDFVEASHIRIETTDEGTKILATMDGKLRTISESLIRRNLKLNNEEGISTLPDAELFENLTLMRQYSRRARIAQSSALPTAVDTSASPLGDDSQREAFPTVSGLEAGQDRENIIKTSALPHDSTPRVTSLATDEGSMQQQLNELTDLYNRLQRQQTEMATKIAAQELEIASLKARIKLLEDKDEGGAEPFGDDATIKGRSLETGEEAGVERSTERGNNDIEELINILTSLDAANILTSGVQVVSVPPAAEVSTVGIPTVSGLVPTASPIFTTASVVTPYSRCKGKEKMVESDTPKKKKLQEQIDVQVAREMEEQLAREDQRKDEQIARDAEISRIHTEEELQMLIDGLDRNNETIAKYLQEYEQFAADLSIEEKIDMINELVKYQDHYAKVLKYQSQQRKPLSKKQQREFYMSVLKSHSRWKTKHFKGMTLDEIREKFILVWKQNEDFVPIASKEEGERFKRKGPRLEQDNAKKMKTAEDVSKEDLKEMMQLVPVEEVYVEALQLWALVKETLSIRHATSDKEKELWVELKMLFEPDIEDQASSPDKAFDFGNLTAEEASSLGEDC